MEYSYYPGEYPYYPLEYPYYPGQYPYCPVEYPYYPVEYPAMDAVRVPVQGEPQLLEPVGQGVVGVPLQLLHRGLWVRHARSTTGGGGGRGGERPGPRADPRPCLG